MKMLTLYEADVVSLADIPQPPPVLIFGGTER